MTDIWKYARDAFASAVALLSFGQTNTNAPTYTMSVKNPGATEFMIPAPSFKTTTAVSWDDFKSVNNNMITDRAKVKKSLDTNVKKKKPGGKKKVAARKKVVNKAVQRKPAAPKPTLEQRRVNLYSQINAQMPGASQEERFYAFTREADRLNLFLRQVKDTNMPGSDLTYRQQEEIYARNNQSDEVEDIRWDIDEQELLLAEDFFFAQVDGVAPAVSSVHMAVTSGAETPAPEVAQKSEENAVQQPQPVEQTVVVTPVAPEETTTQKDSTQILDVKPEKVVVSGAAETESPKVHKAEDHVLNTKISNDGYYATSSTVGAGVKINYVSKDSSGIYKVPSAVELEAKRNKLLAQKQGAAIYDAPVAAEDPLATNVAPEKRIITDEAALNMKVNKTLADAFIGREQDRAKMGKPGLMNRTVLVVIGVRPKSETQNPYEAYMPLTLSTMAVTSALEASGGMGSGLLDHFYAMLDEEMDKKTGYILFNKKFKDRDYNLKLTHAPQWNKKEHIELLKKIMKTNPDTKFVLPGYMQTNALKGAQPAAAEVAREILKERQEQSSTTSGRGKKVTSIQPGQWAPRSVIRDIPHYSTFNAGSGYTQRQRDSIYFTTTFNMVVGQYEKKANPDYAVFNHGMTNLSGFESAGWKAAVPNGSGSSAKGYWQFTRETWAAMSAETGVTVPFTAAAFRTPEGIYAQHVNAKHYHNKKKAYIREREQERIVAGKKPLLNRVYKSRQLDGSYKVIVLKLDDLAAALWAGNDYYRTLERAVDGGSNVMPNHKGQPFGMYAAFWPQDDNHRLDIAMEERKLEQKSNRVVPAFYASQIGQKYNYSTTADYIQQGQDMTQAEEVPEGPVLRNIKVDTLQGRMYQTATTIGVFDHSSTAGGRTNIRYISVN